MPGYTGIASLMSKFNDAPKGEPSAPAEVNTGIVPTIEEIRTHKRKRRLEEETLKIMKMTSLCAFYCRFILLCLVLSCFQRR